MGSIQEALRELRQQRKINENKTVKRMKSLKESNEDKPVEDQPVQEAIVDEDGDVEKTDFDLSETCENGKCEAKVIESEKESINEENYNYSKADIEAQIAKLKELIAKEQGDKETAEKELEHANDEFLGKDEQAAQKAQATIKSKTDLINKYNQKITYWEDAIKNHQYTESINECDQALQEDAGFVDQDGDIELIGFNLTDMFQENLNEDADAEKVTVAAIKKDKNYANLPDKVVNKLIEWAKQDEDVYTLDEFLNWIGGYNSLAECAIDKGNKLDATDFYSLVEGDKKFEDVITNIAKKINWINDQGYYVDDDRKNAKRPTVKELTLDFIRLASPEDKDKEYTFKILKDAYINNDYSMLDKADLSKIFKKLHEDVQSSMPVHPLPETEVIDYINNIPVARGIEKAEDGTVIAKARPTCFFKLGYFKEVEVASKYRGGRGSEGNPFVRIFKAVEYNKLYTGADYENLKGVKQFRKETGIERSGEKTGFSYQGEGATVNKIGTYPDGSKALQAYLANNCQTRTKYFISIDDGDLTEATREEVAQYLTPANANKLLNPQARPKTVERSTDAESGEEIVVFNPQAVNRLKIKNIYMIGNLGNSII